MPRLDRLRQHAPPDGLQAQFSQTTWENPSPDNAMECIDYVSEMNDPEPILLAFTAEP